MSFVVNGANFDPGQYYRDDEQARSILWSCRENPVLLTGLRRIGKSWFLRRFEQIFRAGCTWHFNVDGTPSGRVLESGLPRSAVVLEGGSETIERDLKALIARADGDLVLAVDELEKLVVDPTRRHLVDAILAYRPLVLAASPIIFELARACSPALAQFFEERCVPAVLCPLSRGEKRALALQVHDPSEGVPLSSVEMATWWDWGGHPLVLQQVGALIRERAGMDTQGLTSTAHARLNLGAPAYGASLAGESGLTKAQREVLAQVAAGQDPRDEHVAAVLADHGAIVLRKRGWAIENCVLRRYLQGTSSPTEDTIGSRTLETATTGRLVRDPVRVFSWIHLSDLHFGAGNRKHHFHQEAVMDAICKDIAASAPRPVNRIFVTGDIAFSAQPREYDQARAWFDEIARAAGVPLAQFRLVPGNHDVERSLAKKALARCVHHAVRNGHVELDDLLADSDARKTLTAKLAAYQSFIQTGFADHPDAEEHGIDWFELVPAAHAAHGPIRIAGLSSVWVSDELDGKSADKSPDALLRNLVLAAGPLAQTIGKTVAETLVFVLTHHPQEWMPKDSASSLNRAMNAHTHVHLCGHVHDPEAATLDRFGSSGKSAIRLVAGAAHGDAAEEHGYAWGAIQHINDAKGPRWQLGWAPRGFSETRNEMRPESKEHDLDPQGFAWKDFDCPWPAPSADRADVAQNSS